jgi:O-antigen/teichoic acid export membrane protein
MMPTVEISSEGASAEARAVVRKQIRGSGLLIVGRVLAVGLTAFTQVLIVRHLTTHDFGAWAYALAVVLLWQTVSSLGFQEAIPRFVSIYHQRQDFPRLFGTMFLSIGSVMLSGALVIGMFFAFPDKLLALVHEQGKSLTVLSILIFMVPVEALDGLLMGFFASLASPRSIFFRRHVLAPSLRLGVVLLLIALNANVRFLAFGYLASSVLGIVIYTCILLRHLHREGLLEHFDLSTIRLPCRELFSFVLPMMTSDLMPILNESIVVLLLGYYCGLQDVAFYRVVVPVAAMNHLIGLTSGLLYMPAAARLFANGDSEGLRHLYWRTATWVAVLTFPIFAVTFGFAKPLTVMLYGARYADASTILAILSLGYYFEVMWGFNGMTLKALNKGGSVVTCNGLAALINLTLTLLLIPRYGALGAAITTAATMAVIAILRQVALRMVVGVGFFDAKCLFFYLMIAAAASPLLIVRAVAGVHLYMAGAVAAISMLAVLLVARKELQILEMFPESTRIPLLRRLFA